MADGFETQASLSISIPKRELRNARRTLEEELGDVGVGINAQTGGGGAGASMLADGGRALGELRSLAKDRNDLLRELIDQLQLDGGGVPGGGGGGGGLPGGGGGVPTIIQPFRRKPKKPKTPPKTKTGPLQKVKNATPAIAATAATTTAAGTIAGAGTFGIWQGLKEVAGREQVNQNEVVAEEAERQSTGLGPAFTATAPTGATAIAMTIAERLGLTGGGGIEAPEEVINRRLGIGGSLFPEPAPSRARRLRNPRPSPSSPTERLQSLQGAPTSGGGRLSTGPPSTDLFADRRASRRVGGGADLSRGQGNDWSLGGGGSANVSVDVSASTGEAVAEGVARAVEKHKQEIERNVKDAVEQKLARESGGFHVSGPGGRF